jgi:hypothetical protein
MIEIKHSLLAFLLVNVLFTQNVHLFALPGKFDVVLTEVTFLKKLEKKATKNLNQ